MALFFTKTTFMNVSAMLYVLLEQLFATPTDSSLPGSTAHGILQARILEWVAISFSRGQTWASRTVGRFFIIWATREAMLCTEIKQLPFPSLFWQLTPTHLNSLYVLLAAYSTHFSSRGIFFDSLRLCQCRKKKFRNMFILPSSMFRLF